MPKRHFNDAGKHLTGKRHEKPDHSPCDCHPRGRFLPTFKDIPESLIARRHKKNQRGGNYISKEQAPSEAVIHRGIFFHASIIRKSN